MSLRVVLSIALCLLLFPTRVMPQRRRGGGDVGRAKEGADGAAARKSPSTEEEFAQRAKHHKEMWASLVRNAHYERTRPGLVEYYARGVREVTVKALASKLVEEFEPGTAVLFYDFRGDELSAWLIDGAGLRAHPQLGRSRAQLNAEISELRVMLDVCATQLRRVPAAIRGTEAERCEAEAAAAGSRTLEESVASLTARLLPPSIAGPLGSVKHLIVVPAGGIGAVPFGLLTPSGGGKPLAETTSVTIAPSLYDILPGPRIDHMPAPWEKWDGVLRGALIVGNPALPGDWEKLPAAEKEANTVAEVLGFPSPLTGQEATKRRVVARVAGMSERSGGEQIDLLYFATHGLADGDDPMAGFIALSGEGGREERWTAREIQRRGIPAKLAVLSACQTGLGRPLDGGIAGLARAFQLAGTPRVVMSLWRVHDDSTAELMTAFVSRLRQHPPAEALRLAMLQLKAKRPHPAHWAAFTVFGTPL